MKTLIAVTFISLLALGTASADYTTDMESSLIPDASNDAKQLNETTDARDLPPTNAGKSEHQEEEEYQYPFDDPGHG